MRRKSTVLFAAVLVALAMAAPATAHPNDASSRVIGMNAAGDVVGNGHNG